MIARLKRYLLRVLLYLDILVQSLLWRDPGLTISTRCCLAWRTFDNSLSGRFLQRLGRLINKIEPGHCEASADGDLARASKTIRTILGQGRGFVVMPDAAGRDNAIVYDLGDGYRMGDME